MKTKIAIIGAGASALFSSIILASKNFDVTIYEKNSKVGRKLLTTGNGRCNITNEEINLSNFYSTNINFVKNPIEQFTYKKCKDIFNKMGIEFTKGQKNRVYPLSLTASTVVDIMHDEALSNGVKIKLDSFIENIQYKNNKFILNGIDSFDKVIIATGSVAMPKLGSNPSGYEIAKQFGHNIIEPFASLVQLVSDDKDLDLITGVKIEGKVNNVQDDILFTKYGISGSAILDVSRDISYDLQYGNKVSISIDTMPNFSKDKIADILLKRSKLHPKRSLVLWLDGLINKKLAKYILKKSNIPKTINHAGELNRKDILKIVHTLKNLRFNITDTKGFETCEVCAGGVDVTEVNNHTFESKLQKGLYFIGEVLDVDGDCGGYNLHWAWTSGYLMATNMKESK